MRAIRVSSAGFRYACALAVSAYAGISVLAITGYAGQARTAAQSVYSAAQAKRGEAVYTEKCLACHGEQLEGLVGPALVGGDFAAAWAGHPLTDLVEKIQNTMPQDLPGTLTRPQAIDLTAYLLQVGKYPAGAAELGAGALATVTMPGTLAAKPAAATGAGLAIEPVANLAQFMRGVTFPNANIFFNTQLKDPGKEKSKMPVPYDYVLWGMWAYSGWQQVDQAAMALQETTPLFLLPGRKCQNGKPVPVGNADYQQWTKDLVEFSKQLQKAALTRNVDTVSEMSERLNETCANCHKRYRDVGTSEGGGLGTDRCKS